MRFLVGILVLEGSLALQVSFSKYHGIGNDFILVDNRGFKEPQLSPENAENLCDRNFGIGADGVIFVLDAEEKENDFKMRIYNSDSTEPEMCGNGIRCLARFLKELDIVGRSTDHGEAFKIETGAGVMVPELLENEVTVDMGEPELRAELIPTLLEATNSDGHVIDAPGLFDFKATCVSMGNPHAVVFVPDLNEIDLPVIGPKCEHHSAFPQRVNTEFVQEPTAPDSNDLTMKVWERGAGATLACGTGACAIAVAAVLTGRADRQKPCTIHLPGGDLSIEWRQDDNRLYMSGPATFVFSGQASL